MMDNPLRTPEDYELFLYTLVDRFPSVRQSSVALVRRGATLGRVAGELHFSHGIRIVLRERLVWHRLPVKIDWYGYEVWREEEKLYWYDSQPHPHDKKLQETHPHHKHIPPNMKHNRTPAPEMSFQRTNLPALISEVESLIEEMERSGK